MGFTRSGSSSKYSCTSNSSWWVRMHGKKMYIALDKSMCYIAVAVFQVGPETPMSGTKFCIILPTVVFKCIECHNKTLLSLPFLLKEVFLFGFLLLQFLESCKSLFIFCLKSSFCSVAHRPCFGESISLHCMLSVHRCSFLHLQPN